MVSVAPSMGLRVRLDREGPRLVASLRFYVSAPQAPCRIELQLSLKGEYDLRPRWPWREVVRETAPPYVLRVSNGAGRVVHEQRGLLSRFLQEKWEENRDSGFSLVEHGRWTSSQTITLLELVPREAGAVELVLEVDVRGEVETRWSSSWCEVLAAELRVFENV